MSAKRPRSPSPDTPLKNARPAPGCTPSASPPVPSPSITDRQSRFIAYYHPTLSPSRLLKSLDSITTADHKITAWRHPRAPIAISTATTSAATAGSKPSFDTGSHDDGEKFAGKKVLGVLQEMDATGTLVVARWWGGIMLGPARFGHVERCAREAVGAYREIVAEEERARRELERKGQLVAELGERDRSVAALRGLLDQRRGVGSSPAAGAGAGAGHVGYEDMQVARLEALSRARDGTIAFLLKKLDELDAAAKNGETIEDRGTTDAGPVQAGP